LTALVKNINNFMQYKLELYAGTQKVTNGPITVNEVRRLKVEYFSLSKV